MICGLSCDAEHVYNMPVNGGFMEDPYLDDQMVGKVARLMLF
jgi:hypothetical protein